MPNLMSDLSRMRGMEARARQFPIAQEQVGTDMGLGMAEGLIGELPGAAESVDLEAPEVDVGEALLELIAGACAGGAFIGAVLGCRGVTQ